MKCPPFSNPADYFMRITSVNYPKGPDDEQTINHLKNSYDKMILPQLKEDHEQIKLKKPDLEKSRKGKAGGCL
jgi:hypothetical protein